MTMGIPIGRCLLHSLANVVPGLETSTLESQGTQHFPPGFNQIQVRGILGLEHKLPARMGQAEQQDIGGPMRAQVIHNRIHALDVGRQPGVDAFEKIDPVGRCSAGVRLGEGFTCGRTKCSENVALAPPSVVNLLFGALAAVLLTRRGLDQVLTRMALGRLRPHFIQVHDDAVRRRGGVQLLNYPLFLAKSGSTRSPNHVSCVRQRKPSANRISSRRLRLMAMPFASLRYASSRSNVQQPKGKSKRCGAVSAVAMTWLTASILYVAGRPHRAASSSPANPHALNRLTHTRTVFSLTRSCTATAGTPWPWLICQMICARSTCLAAAVRLWASCRTVSLSSALSARIFRAIFAPLTACPEFYTSLTG